jgi:hypothetical protein
VFITAVSFTYYKAVRVEGFLENKNYLVVEHVLHLGLAPATLEFWVRFPNERNQGKQAHPVLKYRVPHGSHSPHANSFVIGPAVIKHTLHFPPPLWGGAGGGGLLAGTRRRPAAEDGVPPSLQVPPHTHILLARSPAPYSPFRRRAHSPTAFSGPMARPPPSPPRPPPSHIHAGWMVSATRTPTSSAPSQDSLFPEKSRRAHHFGTLRPMALFFCSLP